MTEYLVVFKLLFCVRAHRGVWVFVCAHVCACECVYCCTCVSLYDGMSAWIFLHLSV